MADVISIDQTCPIPFLARIAKECGRNGRFTTYKSELHQIIFERIEQELTKTLVAYGLILHDLHSPVYVHIYGNCFLSVQSVENGVTYGFFVDAMCPRWRKLADEHDVFGAPKAGKIPETLRMLTMRFFLCYKRWKSYLAYPDVFDVDIPNALGDLDLS